jgi:hypothetical protein
MAGSSRKGGAPYHRAVHSAGLRGPADPARNPRRAGVGVPPRAAERGILTVAPLVAAGARLASDTVRRACSSRRSATLRTCAQRTQIDPATISIPDQRITARLVRLILHCSIGFFPWVCGRGGGQESGRTRSGGCGRHTVEALLASGERLERARVPAQRDGSNPVFRPAFGPRPVCRWGPKAAPTARVRARHEISDAVYRRFGLLDRAADRLTCNSYFVPSP